MSSYIKKGLTDKDKGKLFQSFIKTYMKHRRLNADELSIINDIYAAVFLFWQTRIIFDEENSLSKLLKDQNDDEVNNFLNEIYTI